MTRVGTSGYSYEDWKQTFYPADISKGEMLPYYARHFSTTEINSTYYRIPHPRVFHILAERTPSEFDFFVKAYQGMTHRYDENRSVFGSFLNAISPLKDAGKLGGILAQFPWSFKQSPETEDYLRRFREWIPDLPLVYEFRHSSWLKERVFRLLSEIDVAFCCVDEPAIKGLIPPRADYTADPAYIRLHSRDAKKWWKGSKERYDYLYSEEELGEWIERIQRLGGLSERLYIFFNNCHMGHAVKNAQMLINLLSQRGLL